MELNTSSLTMSSSSYARWERLRQEALWTRELQAFVKKADHVVFYFTNVSDAPSWQNASFVEMKIVKKSSVFKQEETMQATFAGHIYAGHRDDLYRVQSDFGEGWVRYCEEPQNVYRPTGGTWLLHLYQTQQTHIKSCLMSLPVGGKIELDVLLGHHSSPLLAESRLHGDVLLVRSTKGKKKLSFDLDVHICRHNSARFGFMT